MSCVRGDVDVPVLVFSILNKNVVTIFILGICLTFYITVFSSLLGLIKMFSFPTYSLYKSGSQPS